MFEVCLYKTRGRLEVVDVLSRQEETSLLIQLSFLLVPLPEPRYILLVVRLENKPPRGADNDQVVRAHASGHFQDGAPRHAAARRYCRVPHILLQAGSGAAARGRGTGVAHTPHQQT